MNGSFMATWPHTRYSLLARLADAADETAWRTFEAVYQPAIYRYARSRDLHEADALEVVEDRAARPRLAPLAVEAQRKAVGLVADPLEQL